MRTQNINDGTVEPVTLAEAKEFARVLTGSLEDNVVQLMIKSARRSCEEYARFSIVRRQWITTYRAPRIVPLGMGLGYSWHDPDGVVEGIALPRRPVHSLDSLGWRTRRGGMAITTADGFYFDMDENRVYWDSRMTGVNDDWTNLVATYTAGFEVGEDNGEAVTMAPPEVKMAVLITVAHYYETRSLGKAVAIPSSAKEQLRGWWQSASVS